MAKTMDEQQETDMQIVGTCGNCGGPVKRAKPTDTGHCTRCGAFEKKDYGPVIPMEPAPWTVPKRGWGYPEVICFVGGDR
jgi:ribosomal protein S27AE